MKGSKHNNKILIIVVIILVFAVGIAAGVVTGNMLAEKKVKEKITSEIEAKKADDKKNTTNSGSDSDSKKDSEKTTDDTKAEEQQNNPQDNSPNTEKDDAKAATGTSTYDAAAPNDDTAIHRYEYILSDSTWQEAYQDCINRGGYLVRINSLSEYEYIRKEISKKSMTNIFFHIGGRRDSGSQDYYWVNNQNKLFGEKLNSDDSWCADEWKKGEPSYKDGSLEELYMNLFFFDGEKRFVWNDIPNDMLAAEPAYSGELGYICEFDN
jgi:hypothetical protein